MLRRSLRLTPLLVPLLLLLLPPAATPAAAAAAEEEAVDEDEAPASLLSSAEDKLSPPPGTCEDSPPLPRSAEGEAEAERARRWLAEGSRRMILKLSTGADACAGADGLLKPEPEPELEPAAAADEVAEDAEAPLRRPPREEACAAEAGSVSGSAALGGSAGVMREEGRGRGLDGACVGAWGRRKDIGAGGRGGKGKEGKGRGWSVSRACHMKL